MGDSAKVSQQAGEMPEQARQTSVSEACLENFSLGSISRERLRIEDQGTVKTDMAKLTLPVKLSDHCHELTVYSLSPRFIQPRFPGSFWINFARSNRANPAPKFFWGKRRLWATCRWGTGSAAVNRLTLEMSEPVKQYAAGGVLQLLIFCRLLPWTLGALEMC